MPAQDARWFLISESIRGCFFRFIALTLLLGSPILWPGFIHAQRIRPHGNSPSESFRQIVRKSGLIFDGTVTGVLREKGSGGAPLAFRVSFQVQQGIRGVRSGSVATVREWAGLWTGSETHEPRYRVGERAVVFFYPPSAGGFTSLVGGKQGKLPVDRAGMIVSNLDWLSDDPAGKAHERTSSVAGLSGSRRIPVRALADQVRLAGGN